MPKTTKYADIENHLNNFRAKLIWTYKLTDIYESKELGDYASWTFKFNICALDKTLSAKDIEIFSQGENMSLYIHGNYDISQTNADFEILGKLSKRI